MEGRLIINVSPAGGGELARSLGVTQKTAWFMLHRIRLAMQTKTYAKLLAETVSPRSLAVMKRQIWEAQFQTLTEATVKANHEMELSFAAEDFKEGVAHYVEKRAPNYRGR